MLHIGIAGVVLAILWRTVEPPSGAVIQLVAHATAPMDLADEANRPGDMKVSVAVNAMPVVSEVPSSGPAPEIRPVVSNSGPRRPPASNVARQASSRSLKGQPPASDRSAIARQAAAVRHIDTRAIVDDLLRPGAPVTEAPVPTNGSLADTYLARLETALGVELERVAGLNDGLIAEVEYHILPDGRLTDVRILRSSHDAQFDDAIVQTIRSFTAGPRPADVAKIHRTIFRTRARP